MDSSTDVHLANLNRLLALGADVHANNDDALRSASNGHVAVVQVLLAAGAYVQADNNYALRYASSNGHLAVVEALLLAGADVHAEDDYALRWASLNGHVAVETALRTAAGRVLAAPIQRQQSVSRGTPGVQAAPIQRQQRTPVVPRHSTTAQRAPDVFTQSRDAYIAHSAARTDAATLIYPTKRRELPVSTLDWAAGLRGDDEHVLSAGQDYYVCTNPTQPHHYDAEYYSEYCRGSTTLPTPLDGRPAKACLLCPYCKNKMDTQLYSNRL